MIKRLFHFLRRVRNVYLDSVQKSEMMERFHCVIDRNARLALSGNYHLKIGSRAYVGAFTVIRMGHDPSRKELTSSLEIGEETYIGELNNIRAGGGTIKIGRKCLISQQVSIIATGHGTAKGAYIADQPWNLEKRNVSIGDDVWIGCGVQILPGVTIGRGAVIGAGSMVNKDVPEYAVVGGNPARILRFRA